jgi:hypothetical protein
MKATIASEKAFVILIIIFVISSGPYFLKLALAPLAIT